MLPCLFYVLANVSIQEPISSSQKHVVVVILIIVGVVGTDDTARGRPAIDIILRRHPLALGVVLPVIVLGIDHRIAIFGVVIRDDASIIIAIAHHVVMVLVDVVVAHHHSPPIRIAIAKESIPNFRPPLDVIDVQLVRIQRRIRIRCSRRRCSRSPLPLAANVTVTAETSIVNDGAAGIDHYSPRVVVVDGVAIVVSCTTAETRHPSAAVTTIAIGRTARTDFVVVVIIAIVDVVPAHHRRSLGGNFLVYIRHDAPAILLLDDRCGIDGEQCSIDGGPGVIQEEYVHDGRSVVILPEWIVCAGIQYRYGFDIGILLDVDGWHVAIVFVHVLILRRQR
mmetsp:Transcript_33358/g.72094  ORF Transcript_33358/g.72094 Transcript_33358/m.72094 type:complete len:337 (+) Transcript_33358:135-1145(+)